MSSHLAIIGSRTFDDYNLLKTELDKLSKVDLICSGGALGADSLGEKWAKESGVRTLIFKPDWNKYGKSAGMIRNKDIISNSDGVICFWDGKSKGTKNSIELSLKLNKPIIIYF